MTVGISDLAFSLRNNSSAQAVPVAVGHANELIAAALGHKSRASYKLAQDASQEPHDLTVAHHVVLDYGLLGQRARDLGVAPAKDQLRELINTAFSERSPHICVHSSYGNFADYLREQVEQFVINDDGVIGEMTNANHDGVDEVYLEDEIEFEREQVPVGGALSFVIRGHIDLDVDTERPYSGHIVNFECTLTVDRLGRQCFGPIDCLVTKTELTGWGDDDHDYMQPAQSLSQAYADLLGLELDEVEELLEADVVPRDGNSGQMIYSYILDFTDHASPEVAKKILQQHSSLRIEVGPSFFENIRSDD